MSDYGIREGYTARLKPDYFNDTQPDGKIWQPDVYTAAFQAARKLGVKRLIDIGCGRAHKLVDVMDEFEIVGIDYGENVLACMRRYPQHTWIAADLEDRLPDIDGKDAIIICADVIEHLQNPTALLAGLARELVCNKLCFLSTPDRIRTYGYDHDGAPSNPHHVREWTPHELFAYTTTVYPLWAQAYGYTRSNNVDAAKNTTVVIYSRPGVVYPIADLLSGIDVEWIT